MSAQGSRAIRVAGAIKERLSKEMSRHLDDPALSSLTITSVTVTDDLSVAHVFVRLLVGDDDQACRKRAVSQLERATPRLRKALGPGLRLKKLPALRFRYDAGHDASRRVEELLSEIERERATRSSDDPPG